MTAAKKTHRITLIPGDGIGPEVSGAVVKIVEAAGAATGVAFDWHPYDAGANAFEKTGEYIPKVLYDSIEKNKVALKGPVTTPIGGGFASINVTLRKKFELFANFRPVKSLPGILLLGRFFSVWDIVAYWVAIAAVALLDGFVIRRGVRC